VNLERNETPVVVLGCELGGLAVIRTLGRLGVTLHGVDADSSAPALRSRYCSASDVHPYDRHQPRTYLSFLLDLARRLGRPAVLIATSDEYSLFVARHRKQLQPSFLFPDNSADLVESLADKRHMHGVATRLGVPTPRTLFPRSPADLERMAEEIEYPVMFKAIRGDLMARRAGIRMAPAHDPGEVKALYGRCEDPDEPNVMLQELIPGDDDQVYIFNGYFDARSRCLSAFTGRKIRQFPVHKGSASLGECEDVPEVARLSVELMQAVGYRGVVDMGFRRDPRDGRYKVLDINPRVGQAFRMFVADNGIDVVRSLYLDLTGQRHPSGGRPLNGTRWMIEDRDLVSCLTYRREGKLSFSQWVRSYVGVRETAWWSWRDPVPALLTAAEFGQKLAVFVAKRIPYLRRHWSEGLVG
jgi:predicted ATP-grasp superfamily ATP-dependent carboligase